MERQRYFEVGAHDCGRVERAVWEADDAAGRPHTHILSITEGNKASMWTEPAHQDRLRDAILQEKVLFVEGPERQVNPR